MHYIWVQPLAGMYEMKDSASIFIVHKNVEALIIITIRT